MTSNNEIFQQILEEEECVLATGFNGALIGHTNGTNIVAVYDYDLCVHHLIMEGMTFEQSIEWMEYNVVNTYVGEKTPIFVSLYSGWNGEYED